MLSKTPFVLLLTISFLTLIPSTVAAQPPVIEWEQNYGGSSFDVAYSIQQTIDGGYIVAGYSNSNDGEVGGNNGLNDFWIIKLDSNGNLDWEQNYGGSGSDIAWNIQQTNDGGYIVVGHSDSSDGDVGGNNGLDDFWILKLSSNGNIEWEQNYGGSDNDRAYSVQQTTDGGYIVAGSSFSSDGDVSDNYGNEDFWVLKLDALGNITWEKNYGGSSIDTALSVQQTTDGGFIVAGTSFSNNGDISNTSPIKSFWVVKLDALGNIDWEKDYGGSNGERPHEIQQTSDGGYIIGGWTQSNDGDVSNFPGGNQSFWVLKIDSVGTLEWEKALGGTLNDHGRSIQQTNDGGYIVAGRTLSNDGQVSNNPGGISFWVVKLDNDGSIKWEKCLGGTNSDLPWSIQQTTDSGYIVAGQSVSNNGDVGGNNGNFDFWVVKLASDSCTPPDLPNFPNQQLCEHEAPYIFDLTLSTLGLNPTYSVSYHTSQADAENNANAILDPDIYEIPGGIQTIYARVEDGNCYNVGSFDIEVVLCPLPDASVSIDNDLHPCRGINLYLEYTVYNTNGTSPLQEQTQVAFYADGVWVAGDVTSATIPPGGQLQQNITFLLPEYISDTFEFKAVVNDDGQGNFIEDESDYTNNEVTSMVTFDTLPTLPQLDFMESCSLGFGTAVFDLTKQDAFLGLTASEEVSFYETYADALAGENSIFDIHTYKNVTNPQTIFVRLKNVNCFAIFDFELRVEDCELKIPQGFSPNGDGINDKFEISGLMDVFPDHEIGIYSRYGNLVFLGNNNTGFWNGTANQGINNKNLLSTGVYYYVLILNHPDHKPYYGWVYLNR